MSPGLSGNSRWLLIFFEATSSRCAFTVGLLFRRRFSSFCHHSITRDWTLILFCHVFLSEISLLELEKWGCIPGSCSNFRELPLLLLFCKSVVAGFPRWPGSPLSSLVWTGLDFTSTFPSCSPGVPPSAVSTLQGARGCIMTSVRPRPLWVSSFAKNVKNYMLQLRWY